jgi:DNA-binding Xre family transcriptional regulator
MQDSEEIGQSRPIQRKRSARGYRQLTINPPVTPMDPAAPYIVPAASGYIRFKIKEVALAKGCVVPSGPHRGEANLSAITRGSGLAWTTVQSLANNADNISGLKLETVARLCAFFQCAPGDLMEFVQYTGRTRPHIPAPVMNIIEDDDSDIMPVPTKGVSQW